MPQVFRTQKEIRFREADPARIMFFGNAFAFAHDAFEEFIVAAGYSWTEWFQTPELMIPIRHSEGDFRAPFRPGESYEIAVSVASFGETSFKMRYVFSRDSRIHAEVIMVHAVLDAKTGHKKPLPALMRSRLEKYLEEAP